MGKSDNKTTQSDKSPADFIASLEHKARRSDAEILLPWFEDLTGLKPKMWGQAIIGFGRYHYKYDSGREGDMLMTGFSPRKAKMVLYIMPGYQEIDDKLARLGNHKIGKSCLYINKLADVDMDVLEGIVRYGVDYVKAKYETYDE